MGSFFITIYRFGHAIARGLKDREFRRLFVFVIAILMSGTLFYHFAEGWSYVDSIYFSVTTLTTVGYGDLHPTGDGSKIFTIIYIFVGIGIILGFVNAVAHHSKKETFVGNLLLNATESKPKKERRPRAKKEAQSEE